MPSGIEEVPNLKTVRAFFRRLNAADALGLMGFLTERYGMANTLYDTSRQMFLEGQLNWKDDDVKVLLVNTTSYTVNVATHKFLSDISSSARVTQPVLLTAKTTTGGAADANDVTFTSVSGETVGAIVGFKDTGTESTSPLLFFIDTATGLPLTPNGGDVIVTWDNGINKIFRL